MQSRWSLAPRVLVAAEASWVERGRLSLAVLDRVSLSLLMLRAAALA